jgi:hypothetical protein
MLDDFWNRKTTGPKRARQNRLRLPISEGGEPFILRLHCIRTVNLRYKN